MVSYACVKNLFYFSEAVKETSIYRHHDFTLTAASCFFSQLLVVQKISKVIVKITVLGFEKNVSAHKSNKDLG